MPIYEYACRSCEHEFETLQKISEAPLVDCPSCGEAELKKKVSAVRFRLKGGGWYETDFKSGDQKNLAGEGARDRSHGEESGAGKEPSAAKDSSGAAESNGDKASTAASGDAKTSNGTTGKTSDGGSTSSD